MEPEFETAQKFHSGSLESVTIEETNGSNVKCTESESTAGKFNKGSTGTEIKLTLKGCKRGVNECKTGAAKEVITTNALKGQLAYISSGVRGEEKPIFALLSEENAPTIAKYTCNGVNYVLEGCIAGRIEKAGKPGPSSGIFGLVYTQASGLQTFVIFEQVLGSGVLTSCGAEVAEGANKRGAGLELKQTVSIEPCPNMDKIND